MYFDSNYYYHGSMKNTGHKAVETAIAQEMAYRQKVRRTRTSMQVAPDVLSWFILEAEKKKISTSRLIEVAMREFKKREEK
jgi:hypothetical protein